MKTKQSQFLILIIIFFFGCSKLEKKEEDADFIETKQNSNVLVDTAQTTISSNKHWDVQTVIGEGTIWREKGNGDNWDSVYATNIFGFKKEISVGEKVQVIPLTKDLPILELKVIKTVKRNDVNENDENNDWYEIKLEKINNKEYWNYQAPKDRRAETPLDFIVVYPSIKNCKLIEYKSIDKGDFPENVSSKIIKGALDFNNDNQPNVIVCKFCCKDRNSVKACDYICTEIYINVSNEWIMINSSLSL